MLMDFSGRLIFCLQYDIFSCVFQTGQDSSPEKTGQKEIMAAWVFVVID